MSTDDIQHFLVIYDPAIGKAEVHEFGTDYEAAQEAYAGLEQENGIETNFDVVLLSADSLETIEQTHSSYFSDRGNSLQKLLSG
jgi:hypothetical protein